MLGTLYNRYVLQLRGFDQIPQFSIESMKYHAREAADWTKDILAAYSAGGNGGDVPGRSAAANPFSHQTQANEELNINDNNSFVRPPATFTRSPQADTNPVSHHTQSRAETQSIRNSPVPPPPTPKQTPVQITPRRVALGSRGPTKEEQDFMLGEEEEGQELENRPISTPSLSSPLPEASTHGAPNTLNRGDVDAAAGRGRISEGMHRP